MSGYEKVFVSSGELERQRGFMLSLKARNDAIFASEGRRPTAYEHSYGCAQNAVDGEKIRGMLACCGYALIDDPKAADVVVYNTCAVRENAEDRVYGNTGALLASKRKNPNKIICLCGCMVQQEGAAEKLKKSFPYVDILLGTHALHKLPELLLNKSVNGGRIFELPQCDGLIAENLPILRTDSVFAGVPISYGCNNFCTYCVVPYVRGRERSRRAEDVYSETDGLIAAGYKDITLLGQNVNSYGHDSPDSPDFPKLLRRVCQPQGDYRIRFMTSHPKDAGQPLFDAMAASEHAAAHLHLPVQSGSDEILRRMNRRYTVEDYLQKIAAARRTVNNLTVTSDIIVGFPGETESDFEDTLNLVRQVGYDSLFMFIYSPRENTPAAAYPDQIPDGVKSERFSRLLALQEELSAQKHADRIGGVVRVLAEQYDEKHNGWCGRDDGVLHVVFDGKENENLRGSFVDVQITSAGPHRVSGRRVEAHK